jgi:hypothetical protein
MNPTASTVRAATRVTEASGIMDPDGLDDRRRECDS